MLASSSDGKAVLSLGGEAASFARPSGRRQDELRLVQFSRRFTQYAEGSVLVSFGRTQVLCNASLSANVPAFLRGSGRGWVTAEYSMLPRSTHSRSEREAVRGKQSSRTQEIQRLIGRSLRCAFDLKALGERTITLDCDVLQADGGTRTAAITGAWLAAYDAATVAVESFHLAAHPVRSAMAAVSVGVCQGCPVLDLDYAEDSACDSDVNVVMTGEGTIIEIQGTAERAPLRRGELDRLLDLAAKGIGELVHLQQKSLLCAI